MESLEDIPRELGLLTTLVLEDYSTCTLTPFSVRSAFISTLQSAWAYTQILYRSILGPVNKQRVKTFICNHPPSFRIR